MHLAGQIPVVAVAALAGDEALIFAPAFELRMSVGHSG
jgi:hypothetical protein